ncbi:Origin recognition complex subunit 3 [Actinomortierella ambigua]|nr:Origin recognition complex subunit 3 [Actinomortierella ambigua]
MDNADDPFNSITEASFLVLPPTAKGQGVKSTLAALPKDHFRLDGFQQLMHGEESWAATQLRHSLFQKEWKRMQARIDHVMKDMNTMVMNAIYEFVDTAFVTKATRAVMPLPELPTGLVFAGINIPDHDVLFQQIALSLSEMYSPAAHISSDNAMDTEAVIANSIHHTVILQSKDCPNLKATLKNMIEQFLGLGLDTGDLFEAGSKFQNYDMIVLERWYKAITRSRSGHRRKAVTLVVIIQDFECFDHETLQDFLTICSNYQDRIPFVFLLGIATSIEAVHQGLPKSVLSLLRTQKFEMQQSSECLTAIIEDLFIRSNVTLHLGPLPLKQLIDQFIHHNFSIGGFMSNLKYIVMHHFYANPLSILTDFDLSEESDGLSLLTKGHYDHLRMLPSFQAAVESKIESDPQEAEMMVVDDEYVTLQLPSYVQCLKEYHDNFALAFEFLMFVQSRFTLSVLKKPKRALYFMALDDILVDSNHTKLLLTLVRRMNSNDMMRFMEDWLELFKTWLDDTKSGVRGLSHTPNESMVKEVETVQALRDRLWELLDVVSEDSVTSGESDNEADNKGRSAGDTVPGEDRGDSLPMPTNSAPTNKPGFIKKRKMVSLQAQFGDDTRKTNISQKTRETLRMPKTALGAYTVLVREICETIERIWRTWLVSYTTLPFHEIFYYSQYRLQQKAFIPQPRASIQTALGYPEQYLNCTCCSKSGSDSQSQAGLVLHTHPDTCILYKLYVECGRMINMYDWYSAFSAILERGNKTDADEEGSGEQQKKKRRRITVGSAGRKGKKSEQQPLDQEQIQARFICAVAEMQFMGFIKPTSRKTDHVMRLTWGSI